MFPMLIRRMIHLAVHCCHPPNLISIESLVWLTFSVIRKKKYENIDHSNWQNKHVLISWKKLREKNLYGEYRYIQKFAFVWSIYSNIEYATNNLRVIGHSVSFFSLRWNIEFPKEKKTEAVAMTIDLFIRFLFAMRNQYGFWFICTDYFLFGDDNSLFLFSYTSSVRSRLLKSHLPQTRDTRPMLHMQMWLHHKRCAEIIYKQGDNFFSPVTLKTFCVYDLYARVVCFKSFKTVQTLFINLKWLSFFCTLM